MNAIGSIGNYFQLANLLSSGSGKSTSTGLSSANPSLVQLLNQSDPGTTQNGANAFLLDLSPQAQQLLSGSSSSANGSSGQFVLTEAQEAKIKEIIEKYKDAPLTQDTFNALQNDLAAAGLSPQTLAAEDQVNSFNPTSVLLSALNGKYAGIHDPANSAANEQAKEANYMESIAKLLQAASASSGGGGSS